MASESSGATAVVAIFAILLLVLVGSFVAWQFGAFGGGGGDDKKLDVDINTPSLQK